MGERAPDEREIKVRFLARLPQFSEIIVTRSSADGILHSNENGSRPDSQNRRYFGVDIKHGPVAQWKSTCLISERRKVRFLSGLPRSQIMYICLKCKEQFSDAMTANGECPFCGTISMMAQMRKNFEHRVLNANTSSIKRLMNYIDKKKLGR